MRRPRAALAALAGAVALLAGACTTGDDAVAKGTNFEFVAPGGTTDITYEGPDRQPLELSGDSLLNEGEQVSTADFAGKVVVLNIWGSWCGPCRTEAPELQDVYEQTKDDGVRILGIDVREPNRDAPRDFMRDRGLTYPSIYDPPGRTLLKLSGYPRNVVPSTIILDRQHKVAAIFLRPVLADDLLPVVRRLAAESAPTTPSPTP